MLMLLTLTGSTLHRAIPEALFSAFLTFLLERALPKTFLVMLFDHPYPFQPLAYIVAFALVFRTNVAYNRYWESASQVCCARLGPKLV